MAPLIDVNVYLSRWPFRRLRGDETPALLAKLRGAGVTEAWAGSFDALLHNDVAGVNLRLAEECRKSGDGFLQPFGAVNPKLPDWEDDLRRCQEVHGMRGIRLHPNYHGYTLEDPVFARLLDLANARKLIVQIALSMEDERTQHPLMLVPHVNPAPLVAHAQRLPNLRIVLINAFRSVGVAKLGKLVEPNNIAFDIAMLENVGGIEILLAKVPVDRILFGSYAPFFYLESSLLKLKESSLNSAQRQAVDFENARKLSP